MITRLKARVFEAIAETVYRHAFVVLGVAALLTAGSTYLALQLEMVNNISEYLPKGSPVVQDFKKALHHFGTSDQLLIVIEGKGEQDAELREMLADAVAARLAEDPQIRSVEYRLTEELVVFYRDTFLRHGLLYLDPEERERLLSLLSDRAIVRQVRENRAFLLSPGPALSQDLIEWDPLNLRSLFLGRLTRGRGQLKIDYHHGYFFSEDLTLLVLAVRPTTTAQDIGFTRQLLRDVKEYERTARQELAEQGFEGLEDIRIGYTGGYVIALEYNQLIRRDLVWNVIVAFAAIMVLFVVGFRRVGSLFYVGAPLVMSLIWNLALVRVTYGHINMFTGVTAAVLLGIGVDFAIHILNRYLAEMEANPDVRRAVRVTLVETGDGAITACGTTMLAFYAGFLTDFPGLQQLGFIAGTGLLLALVANFFVVPAFLVAWARLTPHRHREMTGLGLEPLAGFVGRHPWPILTVAVVVTIVCGMAAMQTGIDSDLTRFRPRDSEAFGVQRLLVERIGSTFNATMVLGHAPEEAAALDLAEKIEKELMRLEERGLVASTLSVNSILPAPARQRDNLEWVKRKRQESDALDADRVVRTLRRTLDDQGFNITAFEPAFQRIRDFLSIDSTLSPAELEQTAIGSYSRRFLSRESGEVYVATYVYSPVQAGAEQRGLDQVLDQRMLGVDDDIQVISNAILAQEFKELIRKDAFIAASVTFVLILGFLYLQFRSFRLVFLTSTPLILGVCWAFGVMTLAGFRFSLISVSILPVILGIGIDDGIYIVNRYRSLGDRDVVHAYHDTGRAVVMTSLTTMAGFGSMALADYPGLVGAGVFAFVGIGACLVTAITVLPALMELFGRDIIEAKALQVGTRGSVPASAEPAPTTMPEEQLHEP